VAYITAYDWGLRTLIWAVHKIKSGKRVWILLVNLNKDEELWVLGCLNNRLAIQVLVKKIKLKKVSKEEYGRCWSLVCTQILLTLKHNKP
jgi:hypothetical protein